MGTVTAAVSGYESALKDARIQFHSHPAVMSVLSPTINPDLLHLFLVYFSALGVQITEPVEGWIQRAGVRCGELGFSDLGRALIAHAKGEADHHLLMVDDTRKLISAWNDRQGRRLGADGFLALAITPGVKQYRKLHEEVIDSEAPYAQLAIEYEIEMLSVTYGPKFLAQCMKVLPSGTLGGLSFISEHVSLDVGHTQFNRKQLDAFLTGYPDGLLPLVNAGVAALAAYSEFLADCLALARTRLQIPCDEQCPGLA